MTGRKMAPCLKCMVLGNILSVCSLFFDLHINSCISATFGTNLICCLNGS